MTDRPRHHEPGNACEVCGVGRRVSRHRLRVRHTGGHPHRALVRLTTILDAIDALEGDLPEEEAA